jgi:hypothetical protein
MSASITSGTYPRAGHSTALPLRRWAHAVWHALLQAGQARAVPHLLQLARDYEHSDPQLAAQFRRAARGVYGD